MRKQTAATLKSLQALMAIQVRARVSRIQLLEDEEELLERRRRKRIVDTNLEEVYKVNSMIHLVAVSSYLFDYSLTLFTGFSWLFLETKHESQ